MLRRVSSCINFFEACTAFILVTACKLAKSPKATLCTRGFSSFVTSTTALIATGWSEPVPGRVYPAVDQRLSRRTQLPVYQSDRILREPQTWWPLVWLRCRRAAQALTALMLGKWEVE